MSEKVIIEMTPFIFEDGNTYYFKVFNRPSAYEFRDLYVYEKIVTTVKPFWGKEKIKEEFKQLNTRAELIDSVLNTREIKNKIKQILNATKVSSQLLDWDGFVGDIPEHVKKSLGRDTKLKDLGIS